MVVEIVHFTMLVSAQSFLILRNDFTVRHLSTPPKTALVDDPKEPLLRPYLPVYFLSFISRCVSVPWELANFQSLDMPMHFHPYITVRAYAR